MFPNLDKHERLEDKQQKKYTAIKASQVSETLQMRIYQQNENRKNFVKIRAPTKKEKEKQEKEEKKSPTSIQILHAVAKMITKGGQQCEGSQYAFKDQVPFAQHVPPKQKRNGQQICESGDEDPYERFGIGPATVIAGRASTIGRRANHEQFMALKISVATGIACGAHVG